MKHIITITSLLAAGTILANAETTKIADISDLLSGSTGTGITASSDWTYSGGSVYDFSAENAAFLNGSNSAVLNAINAASGYVTIAAWVNITDPDSSTAASNPNSGSNYQTIFGFGEDRTGFKFCIKDNGLAFVTKYHTEERLSSDNVALDGTWTLVGVSFSAGAGSGARLFGGTETYEDKTLGAWTEPSTANTFSIGSANSNAYAEGFNGLMAGLSVFTSDSYLSGADIASFMGNAPSAVPEPSAFGLLAGLGALALAGTRRRRRKA